MENFGKRQFFRANMAGLGKYHTGGYGRIGVHRINLFDLSPLRCIKKIDQLLAES